MLIPGRNRRAATPINGMLMQVRRALAGLVLLVAIAIALEPVLHTHKVLQTSDSPCAVCVSSIGRVTPLTISAVSPLIVVGGVTLSPVAAPAKRCETPLASRAPPAA